MVVNKDKLGARLCDAEGLGDDAAAHVLGHLVHQEEGQHEPELAVAGEENEGKEAQKQWRLTKKSNKISHSTKRSYFKQESSQITKSDASQSSDRAAWYETGMAAFKNIAQLIR